MSERKPFVARFNEMIGGGNINQPRRPNEAPPAPEPERCPTCGNVDKSCGIYGCKGHTVPAEGAEPRTDLLTDWQDLAEQNLESAQRALKVIDERDKTIASLREQLAQAQRELEEARATGCRGRAEMSEHKRISDGHGALPNSGIRYVPREAPPASEPERCPTCDSHKKSLCRCGYVEDGISCAEGINLELHEFVKCTDPWHSTSLPDGFTDTRPVTTNTGSRENNREPSTADKSVEYSGKAPAPEPERCPDCGSRRKDSVGFIPSKEFGRVACMNLWHVKTAPKAHAPAEGAEQPQATCETHGHLYGHKTLCMFCGAPKPPSEPDEEGIEFGKWVGLGYTADFYDGAAQAWGEQARRKSSLREQLAQAQADAEDRRRQFIVREAQCEGLGEQLEKVERELEEARALLHDAVLELGYVHSTEDISQVISPKGKEIVDDGMKLLGLKDLSDDSWWYDKLLARSTGTKEGGQSGEQS